MCWNPAVFNQWIEIGVIEDVPFNAIKKKRRYLPLRGIIKELSTTKVRPEFDASCGGTVLNYHLKDESSEKNCVDFPETVSRLMKPFYFDNCITSVSNKNTLHRFSEESKHTLATACFYLKGLEFTSLKIGRDPSVPILVLGLLCSNKDEDYIFCDTAVLKCSSLNLINQVQEIKSLTSNGAWKHVPGNLYAAIYQECSLSELVKSRRWEGPDWLKGIEEEGSKSEVVLNVEKIQRKRRNTAANDLTVTKENWYLKYFSTNFIIVRMTWNLRFLRNCRQPQEKMTGNLTVQEINLI
ncbi:hypothetical protein NPIL_358591 [Nephila pilipes]|uniref:Uncharacterized protein n=1 Tax=Nephila pilipes TaxID=299642 RepID=A0A8X6N719_NEPPI|nr:hypothetical protein NPIL_358591 [Nephila pilipes]